MEVPRRIELMPVAPVPKKETKKTPQTIRFTLDLSESTDKTCPEFSYEELLRNALGKKKKKKKDDGEEPGPQVNGGANPDDPFGDDEDDAKLQALAASFEAKYGRAPGKNGRKGDRLVDLVDLGEGYDDEDSFIDNTEAYDELVPASLETKHGGFYINSGKLDFKETHLESDDDFESPKIKKKKKKLEITSDSEDEKRVLPKKKFSHKNVLIKKRKKLSNGNVEGAKPAKKPKLGEDGQPKKRGRPKVKKTPPSVQQLIEQVKKSTTSGLKPDPSGAVPGDPATADMSVSRLVSDSSNLFDSAGEDVSKSPKPEAAPEIPDSVSASLRDNVEKIKTAARGAVEGKKKFFKNSTINALLLDIESESQSLTPAIRKTIYAHLAAFLPIGLPALMKRARKLRTNEQDDKLKEPLARLQDAVGKVMPEQLEKYNNEVREATRLYQEKQQLWQQQKQEKDELGATTTESDEPAVAGGATGEKGAAEMKRFKAPNKKFTWTDHLRQLLCTVVRIKMTMYDASDARTQSAEEYLKAYLETEVRTLWPQGWMQARMLYKESRSAHEPWTSLGTQPKPKKPVISDGGHASTNPVATTNNTVSENTEKTTKKPPPVAEKPAPNPTPTLLDYASKSYMSAAKSKISSTPITKPEKGNSGTDPKPVTSTPAVTPIRSSPEQSTEAMRSINMLANLAASSKLPVSKPSEGPFGAMFTQSAIAKNADPFHSPVLKSPPISKSFEPFSVTAKSPVKTSPPETPDFMAQFREFTKSFRQENRDSPPALTVQSSSVNQGLGFKQNWDQAGKQKEAAHGKPKVALDQQVSKTKLSSGVNVVKVSRAKQSNGTKTAMNLANRTSMQTEMGQQRPPHVKPAASVASILAAASQSNPVISSLSENAGHKPQCVSQSNSSELENILRLKQQEQQQLAKQTATTEKKRLPQQHIYEQGVNLTSRPKPPTDNLFSVPSAAALSQPYSAQPTKHQTSSPVASSSLQQQAQQQLHKQGAVPRASPSPNRASPVTPPRSSPGTAYSNYAHQVQAQIQQQQHQQQQRTKSSSGTSQVHDMWRTVDPLLQVSRSPGTNSFPLPSGMQRSPEFFLPSHGGATTGSSASAAGTPSFPMHMMDLSQAKKAHDIAAAMRSPSSPALSGPRLYGSNAQGSQSVGVLQHPGFLGAHSSQPHHSTGVFSRSVHGSSPLTPGTPPFSSHPYADQGQQYR